MVQRIGSACLHGKRCPSLTFVSCFKSSKAIGDKKMVYPPSRPVIVDLNKPHSRGGALNGGAFR
ncbi:MAG: hypothetical protein KAW12_25405, partial [Candidatus Aminicenantes bacterium]|nr:hypothetical protein [Candidatus Aminicenantes bacterium]